MTDNPSDRPKPPSSLFDLAGQVALVTGASRGIGWATARTLAAAGAHLVHGARDAGALAERVAWLAGHGLSGEAMAFDAADAERLPGIVADIATRHGRLDIVVANAAATVRKPLVEQDDADWARVVDVALTGPWRLAREAARAMIPAGRGRIVMVSSINAVVARPGIGPYIAAKAGLEGLVRSLALDLGPHGITANAVAPGYVPTAGNAALRASRPEFEGWIAGRTPAGRWGTPEEIAAAILYLASPAAGFTNGAVLTVDGGLSIAI